MLFLRAFVFKDLDGLQQEVEAGKLWWKCFPSVEKSFWTFLSEHKETVSKWNLICTCLGTGFDVKRKWQTGNQSYILGSNHSFKVKNWLQNTFNSFGFSVAYFHTICPKVVGVQFKNYLAQQDISLLYKVTPLLGLACPNLNMNCNFLTLRFFQNKRP